MTKYKMVLEYDGTKYKGWQRLSHSDKTIQQKVEMLLSKLIEEAVEIHGSGRTDAGVHAFEQVAHFETEQVLDLDRLLYTCNEMLPQDIVIKSLETVNEDFHARHSAKSKIYVYKIWNGKIPTALKRNYTYHVPKRLDIEKMKKAASYLIGMHDFHSFTATKSKKKSMIREIYQIDINKNDDEIEIIYHGNGFLYKMIRILTGTLIEVGLGERSYQEVEKILELKDRQYAGETVPSQGLYLFKVFY